MIARINIAGYTLDTLPEATAEDLAHLQKLAEAPDESIDFSDIPPLTEYFWASTKRADELFRPRKRQITVRIDADVLAWLKSRDKIGESISFIGVVPGTVRSCQQELPPYRRAYGLAAANAAKLRRNG